MDRLESMKVFVRVAQRSSFAAAARELRLSPASVTKHVAASEARLGVRLLDRTTRHVSLTEAGRAYLDRCIECLQAADDADAAATTHARGARGALRIAAPIDLQSQLAAALARWLAGSPHVEVDLQFSNRAVDLVEEGVDVAVRVAPALEGGFVARPLAMTRLALVASSGYLAERGRPRAPSELAEHRAVVFAEPRPRTEWSFVRAGRTTRVTLRAHLVTNGGDAVVTAVRMGAGIAIAPSFVVGELVRRGELEPLLGEWEIGPPLRVFALYPHRRLLSPKVRSFVEAMIEAWGGGAVDPWWPSSISRTEMVHSRVRHSARTRRASSSSSGEDDDDRIHS